MDTSIDKRPDLLQYRQLLGTLDPAGIPLVSATLAGNGADDPLYWPTWQRMAQVIGHNSFVFLADCKAAAIATRAQIAAKGGIYCFPVPMSGLHPLLLKQWVLDPPTPSVDIRLRGKMRMTLRSGEALRWSWANSGSTQPPKRGCGGMSVIWSFTRPDNASTHIRGLHQRLTQAQTALDKLAAKPGDELEPLNAKVETILKRHRVNEFFSVTTTAQTVTQTRYVGRGRPCANSPTQQVTRMQLQLQFHRQPLAIEQAEQLAGWRLYLTNAPIAHLSLPQAILYYPDEWLLERGFHRLKRGQLPALPIYFQNQERIVGLMFLLSLALRVFTLVEFVVRLSLQKAQQSLAGLYDGNPKRATARPSAEQLLKAFGNLTLYFLPDASIFVTPLCNLQQQILSLMKLPESLYQLHLKPHKT